MSNSTTRDQIDLMPAPGASGLVLLCLPLNLAEAEEFNKWAEQVAFRNRQDIIVGVAERTGRVTELLYELRCLDWVEKNTPELRDDPVARRELRTRFSDIQSLIQNSLDRSLSIYRLRNSVDCRWFYAGKEISSTGKSRPFTFAFRFLRMPFTTKAPILGTKLSIAVSYVLPRSCRPAQSH